MIQITLTVSAAQLAQIAAIMEGEAQPSPAPTPRKAKTEEPAVTATEAKVQGKDAEGDDVAEVPTQEAVTAAAMKLSAKNGREAVAELVGRYGAKNVSGIPEAKRAEFIAACEA